MFVVNTKTSSPTGRENTCFYGVDYHDILGGTLCPCKYKYPAASGISRSCVFGDSHIQFAWEHGRGL